MRTVDEIENALVSLQDDIDQIQVSRTELESQIADRWGEDTGDLEMKAAALIAKEQAAAIVRSRLEQELHDAKGADLEEQIKVFCKRALEESDEKAKLFEKAKRAARAYQKAREAYLAYRGTNPYNTIHVMIHNRHPEHADRLQAVVDEYGGDENVKPVTPHGVFPPPVLPWRM